MSRETLNTHLRGMGHDPDKELWGPIHEVIRNVYRAKEHRFKEMLDNYQHRRAFFEMVR